MLYLWYHLSLRRMALYRRLRQQGGSVVVSIPANLLELFGVGAGDEVAISISRHDAGLVVLDMRGRTPRVTKTSKRRKEKK